MKITKSTRNTIKVSEYDVFTTSLPQSVMSSYEATKMRREYWSQQIVVEKDKRCLAARNQFKAKDDYLKAALALDNYDDNSEVEYLLLCFNVDNTYLAFHEARMAFIEANKACDDALIAYDRAIFDYYRVRSA